MSIEIPIGSGPGVVGMASRGPIDLVLDASIAIKWYIPENRAVEARRFMAPRFAMHVPSFFSAEAGNTIWKKTAQRHELDRQVGRQILDELWAYPKQVHDTESLTPLAYDLAHEVGKTKLAIYDFIYLALAIALDCRVVTADGPFRDVVLASPFAHHLFWVDDPLDP